MRPTYRCQALKRTGPKLKENLTNAEACLLEIAFIAAIGRKANGGPLVNLTDGGEGISGLKHTEETRAAMRKPKSASAKANNSKAQIDFWASKSLEERKAHFAAMSVLGNAVPWSDERRVAHGIALKNSPNNAARAIAISKALKNRVRSPEHCQAISKSRIGVKRGSYPETHRAAIRAGQLAAWALRRAFKEMLGAS